MDSGVEFFLIFSKFSKSCNEILPVLKQIKNFFPLKGIDIDNPETRNWVLSNANIKTVPCFIIKNPQETTFYEGAQVKAILEYIVNNMPKPEAQSQKEVTILDDLPANLEEDEKTGLFTNSNRFENEGSKYVPSQRILDKKSLKGKSMTKIAHEMMKGREDERFDDFE